MQVPAKFTPIRKGLLEFVVLTVIAKNRVYAADILKTLAPTEFATQEGTLYPLLSGLRRDGARASSGTEILREFINIG